MPTLVQRVREIVSVESDDFFSDDTILFYLNRTATQLASYYINVENKQNVPLHVLDKLRRTQEIDLTNASYTQKLDFFKVSVISGVEPMKFLYLLYNNATPIKPIKIEQQQQIELGHIVPTPFENYYIMYKIPNPTNSVSFDMSLLSYPINEDAVFSITDGTTVLLSKTLSISDPVLSSASSFAAWFISGTVASGFTAIRDGEIVTITKDVPDIAYDNKSVTFEKSGTTQLTSKFSHVSDTLLWYTHEQNSDNKIQLYYIANPELYTISDEDIKDFPARLENALLYGAALSVLTQESLNSEIQATNVAATYKNELSIQAY